MTVLERFSDTDDEIVEGKDFETVAEARATLVLWPELHPKSEAYLCRYVMIDGPDIHEVIPNPHAQPSAIAVHEREEQRYAEQCRREAAMQAGMTGGCEAYNDAMGMMRWDSDLTANPDVL